MRSDRTDRARHDVAAQVDRTVEDALSIIEQLARDTDEPASFVVDEVFAGNVRFDHAESAIPNRDQTRCGVLLPVTRRVLARCRLRGVTAGSNDVDAHKIAYTAAADAMSAYPRSRWA
jgi:hypothetical protein